MTKNKESLKKIIDEKVKEYRTVKPKLTEKVEEKVDGRSKSSKLNSAKAREAKLKKLAEKKEIEKEMKQSNIQEQLQPKVIQQEQSDESDDEEIIIINPPPIDPEKQMKKELLMKQQQEMYEWMQAQRIKQQHKQPKQQNPVVINMSTPPKLSEEDEHLKRTLISKIQQPVIRF
jgi:hypothetical protein